MADQNHLARIRLEYNEAPSQVIRGYRDNGYPQAIVAGALGIGRATLQGYCKRFGIKFSTPSPGWPKGKPRSKRVWNSLSAGSHYTDEEMFAAILDCPRSHIYKQQKRRPNISLIYERFGSWGEAKRLAINAARSP